MIKSVTGNGTAFAMIVIGAWQGNRRRRGALAGGKGERQMPKDFAHHENPFIHARVHSRDELWYSIWGEPNTYLRRTCFNSGELSRTKFYPRRIDL